jgi:hypothetical protein
MAFMGLGIALLGFLLAAASVGITDNTTTRLGIVLLGIFVSLFGIVGVLNPAYMKDAIWKK